MIGECKVSEEVETEWGWRTVRCAGNKQAYALISRSKSSPTEYLREEEGKYYWTHTVKVGMTNEFWYCRECHTEILFRKLKQGEMK